MLLTSVLKSLVKQSRKAAEGNLEDRLRDACAARESGDVTRGLEILRGILSRRPDHVHARYLTGLWLAQEGRHVDALPHLQRAATLMPADADVQLALGNVYKAGGDRALAEASYREAIALAPESAAGYYNLGLLRAAAGDRAEGLVHLEHACGLRPYIADAWRERTLVLIALGRYQEAISVAQRAVERDPDTGDFWCCLGYAYLKAHDPQSALGCYDRAHDLGVADHEFYKNVAIVYQELGRMEDAIAAYERAIAAKPGDELARFHLALAHLALGRYGRCWEDYDLRLLSEDNPLRIEPRRAWRGEALAGRTILIRGEQGLGDELMFASCFGDMVRASSRCIVTCVPRLEKLFRRSFPGASVVGLGPNQSATVGKVDFEVAAGTLPRYLRRSSADFPRHTGYLHAEPARVEYWKHRLATLGRGVKVGISWRGGTHETRAPLRTVPLPLWEPILRTAGAQFVSLQYGETDDDLRKVPRGVEVVHWPEAIDDYDETAALVSALDVVISVCTAVIHLSGALGRPVWIMAPLSPEWRYKASGDTMDWYPSSRMFRQREFGCWQPVVASVAAELHGAVLAAGKAHSS